MIARHFDVAWVIVFFVILWHLGLARTGPQASRQGAFFDGYCSYEVDAEVDRGIDA
jgi:hypothetical protein